MKVVKHLSRGYGVVYAWFWGIIALVMAALLASLTVFGVWLNPAEQGSAWRMVGSQAPLWFVFTIGLLLATTNLPVVIAQGVTRREYAMSVGILAVGTAVLFGLLSLVIYGIEYGVFRATGILEQLELAYPWPTAGYLGRTLLAHLAFMLTGWLIGLCFYRLRPWYAILLTPIAGLPIAVGIRLPSGEDGPASVLLTLLLVGLGAAASYLIIRAVPIRPKKA